MRAGREAERGIAQGGNQTYSEMKPKTIKMCLSLSATSGSLAGEADLYFVNEKKEKTTSEKKNCWQRKIFAFPDAPIHCFEKEKNTRNADKQDIYKFLSCFLGKRNAADGEVLIRTLR